MYNILLVEDDHSARFAIRKSFPKDEFKLQMAVNGAEGLKLAKEEDFDIIITDWLMPEMDGIELITRIRKEKKKQPIIFLLTAVSSSDAKHKALFAGADEYLTKPVKYDQLIDLVKTSLQKSKTDVSVRKVSEIINTRNQEDFYCIGIAASTGGPSTLLKFFEKLEKISNAAILIVLHGPKWMLESFVNSLQSQTKMNVKLGFTGQIIENGNVYLAPGNMHMVLAQNSSKIELLDTPPENFVKPSADPLFRSIAQNFGNKSIGMVFTGMGKDGAYGSGYIHAAGGKVIVQDPTTAILDSMPKAVISLNLADEIVPLDSIHQTLYKYLK